MKLLRYAGTVLAVLALSLGAGTVPASAHAKLSPYPTSCAGGQLDHHDLASGALSVFMFYSSVNGGTNCNWVQKNVHRGTGESLNIVIYRCVPGDWQGQPSCVYDASDSDPGVWKYYAGPVRVSNAAGRCIGTEVFYRGVRYNIPPHHCG